MDSRSHLERPGTGLSSSLRDWEWFLQRDKAADLRAPTELQVPGARRLSEAQHHGKAGTGLHVCAVQCSAVRRSLLPKEGFLTA